MGERILQITGWLTLPLSEEMFLLQRNELKIPVTVGLKILLQTLLKIDWMIRLRTRKITA